MGNLLLLDEGWVANMHVAAGLRRAGFRCHRLGTKEISSSAARLVVSQELAPPIQSAEYLAAAERIIAVHSISMVLPLTDRTLHRIWQAAPSWMHMVRPTSEPWQRALLLNKRSVCEFVSTRGVSIPLQRVVGSLDEVEDVLEGFGMPAVIKGITSCGGSRVRVVAERGGIRRSMAEMLVAGEELPTLQEFIVGQPCIVAGLFVEGEPVRLFAAEKIEAWPELTGPATRLRTTDDPRLIGAATAAFRALRWTGLAQADLVRHSSGRCVFIEMNVRPWGSIAAARQVGVDLFTPYAALLRGGRPIPDLAFGANRTMALVPQRQLYLLSTGGMGAVWRMLADPAAWRAVPWHDPALAVHILARVCKVLRALVGRRLAQQSGIFSQPWRAWRLVRRAVGYVQETIHPYPRPPLRRTLLPPFTLPAPAPDERRQPRPNRPA